MTGPMSSFGSFGQEQRILDVNTEVADGVLDLRVPKQDLYSARAANRLVDH